MFFSLLYDAFIYLSYTVLGCVILFYLLFLFKNIKVFKFAYTNNGFFVPILPFVGTVYLGLFTGDALNMLSTMNFFKKLFGFPCNIWISYHYLMVNTDPAELKIILNHPKCLDKPVPFYEIWERVAKHSVFSFSGNKWKVERKHLMRSYRPTVLKTFQQIFYRESCDLLEEFKNQMVPEDLFHLCTNYAFKAFFLTSVGLEEEKMDLKKMYEFGLMIDKMQDLLSGQVIDPVTPIDLWFRLFPKGRKMAKMLQTSKSLLISIIQQKRKQHEEFQDIAENIDELPLLDSLLYEGLSEEEILEEMYLFATAATDTSGNVLAFCLVCLGVYPEIQETLYNEIMDVIGSNSISNDDLHNLKYTEAVIHEAMRIFPSIPLVGRYLDDDIDVGSRVIPKGTIYAISILHLHREPKYWENPLDFDPTRFLPGKVEKILPYTYMPFCSGHRDCIGKSQAMMLLKMTVANIVRNFKLTSDIKSLEDIHLSSCLTMKATNPPHCRFTPRQD